MKRRVIFPPDDYWTHPPEKENPMAHMYGINPSAKTIIIGAIENITAAYGHTNDDDDNQIEYVALYIRDAKIGELFIPMALPFAAQLVGDVAGVLGNRDELRRQYDGQEENQ